MAKARRPVPRAVPKFYARSPGVAAPVITRERGLVWAHRPDGSYKADGTGGTFWLMPVAGGYRTVWMGAHGVERDLGVHAYGSAVQVAARFDPVSGQQREAAENPIGGSLLDPDFAKRYRHGVSGAHEGAAENPMNFQRGERLRIRSKGPQGQSFDSFWFTVPSPMTPEEVALQFAQTDQPGMLTEIVQGKSKWTYRKGLLGGQSTVTRVQAAENPVIRYSDQDILRLLRDTNRPAWERTAHITAAARQRGYSGDESNQERMIHFLEASLESVVPEGPGYEDASLRHARENPRGGPIHVEVVELPKWGSDRSKWAVKVNGKTVGSYWNKEHADKKAESLRSGAADNPLDTSVDGWTRWHGDPPNEVGNLGPGQQVQTADGWWYRQDQGADAGHLFFQAAPGGPVPTHDPNDPQESIPYVETYAPIDAPVIDAEYVEVITPMPPDYVGLAPELPPPGELPIEALAVENPRRPRTDPTAWRHGPEGEAKYRAARAEAQQKANEFGYDFGVEANDVFKSFMVMMLPRAENRSGYELRVEVVHPENLSTTQPGHGPMARANPRRREPNEFLQGLEAKKAARAAVFAALQSDPVYNRLFERKDAALRAWNHADAYKNHPAHKPGEVEAADRRAKYAMKQVNDYEEAALRKAGCW